VEHVGGRGEGSKSRGDVGLLVKWELELSRGGAVQSQNRKESRLIKRNVR
jgi:hypothetical protein